VPMLARPAVRALPPSLLCCASPASPLRSRPLHPCHRVSNPHVRLAPSPCAAHHHSHTRLVRVLGIFGLLLLHSPSPVTLEPLPAPLPHLTPSRPILSSPRINTHTHTLHLIRIPPHRRTNLERSHAARTSSPLRRLLGPQVTRLLAARLAHLGPQLHPQKRVILLHFTLSAPRRLHTSPRIHVAPPQTVLLCHHSTPSTLPSRPSLDRTSSSSALVNVFLT
jgi:hypothetical protein